MAKGQILKKEIQNKILEAFPGSFLYNDGKEIRICGTEGGEQLQIKCTLTCAKENVESGADTAIPQAKSTETSNFPDPIAATPTEAPTVAVPTEAEKKSVAELLAALGL